MIWAGTGRQEALLSWSGSKDSQLAPSDAAGRVSWGIPQITLGFPTRAGAQLFCLTWRDSLETQWVLSSSLLPFFVPEQKEGAGLYYFYLGCAFPVNEPQTFQIIHIHSHTKMDLAPVKWLQNGTDIFRYPRLLMSCRAGWPLIPRSRHSKTNSYFAGVLQDSTLNIH